MKIDCYACGGEGWLPSLPEGKSECPYCDGLGKTTKSPTIEAYGVRSPQGITTVGKRHLTTDGERTLCGSGITDFWSADPDRASFDFVASRKPHAACQKCARRGG